MAHDLLDEKGKGEVDGLPVPVLDGILSGFITGEQDPYILQGVREEEDEFHRELRSRYGI